MPPVPDGWRLLEPALLASLADEARALDGLQAILRFESHGTVFARDDSYLGLAFLGARTWPHTRTIELAARLSSLSDRTVQCVDLRAVPGLVALEMLEEAEPLFVPDILALDLSQTRLDAERLNLGRWRRDILEGIRRRGTIHGG